MGDMLRMAETLGALLLSALQAAICARDAAEIPHYLYMDEVQHFCGPGFEEFLRTAESRKVGVVLAHQSLAQLRGARGTALEESVLRHTHTSVLVRCDAPDAETLAPWLPAHGGRHWNPAELAELPFGLGVARISGKARTSAHVIRLRYVGGQSR